jgi:ribosomal protein S18 acetylase RimI-like enzyme
MIEGERTIQELHTEVKVKILRSSESPAAVTILARAFDQEPTKLVMLPDARLRRTFLEWTVKARLFDAMRYGTVHGAHVDGELGAIALWYPPGVPMLSLTGALRMGLSLLSNIGSVARAVPNGIRVMLSDLPGALELAMKRRPAVVRASRGLVWELELLGTSPEHRRKGLARALLDRQLLRCDQDGAAAWLEATDPVNPPIYERFGFETIAHIEGPSWLPGYWVMRREPVHQL